ncbi:hypothetical protein AADG42_00835 [Ammonicoccus fulvus]|uniref:DUF4131 domain-containing protein n=1 Tax=Ammonicoccus fulvus TaxID=3138240 RepID=A0ABZ3FIW1_9ACTN
MSNELTSGRSVLPQLEVRATASGVEVVRDASARAGRFRTSLIIGIIGVSIPLFNILFGGLVASTWSFPGFWFGIFGLVGLGSLGVAGWNGYQLKALGDAHLELPQLPLRLGETVTIRYSQRRNHSAEVRAVTATLLCREWVRFTRGTDTETRTHDLWQTELPSGPSDPIGDLPMIRGMWQLTLPAELPPSFTAPDNAVQWILTIRADIAGRPDAKNEYTLPVAPVVVRNLC